MNELAKLRELTETLTSNGYLKDQTEAWKYAFDSVNEFICIVNPSCKIKFVNKSLLNLLNTTQEELINKRLKDVFDSELVSAALEDVVPDEEGVHHFGITYVPKYGRWFDQRKLTIKDSSNNVIGYMFIIEDVTEVHEAKLKLTAAYKKLRYLVDVVDGYIWEKEVTTPGAELVHTFVDRDFCRDFYDIEAEGVEDSCAEAIGKTTTELLENFRATGRQHSFGDICISTDAHCMEQGVPCEYFEMGYIEKSKGSPKWFIIRVRKTPVYDDNGDCVGVMGFANNCSLEAEAVSYLIKRGLVTGSIVKLDACNLNTKVYWVKREQQNDKVLTSVDFP